MPMRRVSQCRSTAVQILGLSAHERSEIRAYLLSPRLPDMELGPDGAHGRNVPGRQLIGE
jgi:hypothetical protein